MFHLWQAASQVFSNFLYTFTNTKVCFADVYMRSAPNVPMYCLFTLTFVFESARESGYLKFRRTYPLTIVQTDQFYDSPKSSLLAIHPINSQCRWVTLWNVLCVLKSLLPLFSSHCWLHSLGGDLAFHTGLVISSMWSDRRLLRDPSFFKC